MKNVYLLFVLNMFAVLHANSFPLDDIKDFYKLSYKLETDILNAPSAANSEIRSNVYGFEADNSTFVVDGTLTQYGDNFSNAVDGMDARKLSNFSENFGMLRGNTELVIERRQTINKTDTIFYNFRGMKQKPYLLEFVTAYLDHPDLEGVLEDNYLNVKTPLDLNGKTQVTINVNADPKSSAPNRFRIIFKTIEKSLPLSFTSAKAYQQNNFINVEWNAVNTLNIKTFIIEKSMDGSRFEIVSDIQAKDFSTALYSWVDDKPLAGNNFYKIRGVSNGGEITYTDVLKVYINNSIKGISAYPNPVQGDLLNLLFVNQSKGVYQVNLINLYGRLSMSKTVNHTGSNTTVPLFNLQNLQKGSYQLIITNPNNSKVVVQIIK